MDVNKILDLAVDQSHTNSTDYPNSRTIDYLNIVKDDFFTVLITAAWEDWNWDIWETDSVVWQNEYVLPEAASDTEGNIKVSRVSISYNWETEDDGSIKYTPARLVKLWNLPKNWNFYTNQQSQLDPIYYVADKSIFIAPAPISSDWAIVDWIQIKWIKSIQDYVVWWNEASIKLPHYLHLILVQGILQYIHRSEWNK